MSKRELDIQGVGMTSQRTRNRLVQRLKDKGIQRDDILYVMSKVPRHLFVDEALASRAYEDTALPIGYGQTISQPFIVAKMTELVLASTSPLSKVLEIGTGSGYQAAVLAPFVSELFTLERIEPLLRQSQQLLNDLGYRNIKFQHDDGSVGLVQYAPFDAIIATAAAEKLPEILTQQLAIGGRLIIPVGRQGVGQTLTVITRLAEAEFVTEAHGLVQFVPMLTGL